MNTDHHKHEILLKLALALSLRAESSTFPNPMVGAIITNSSLYNLNFVKQHSQELLKILSSEKETFSNIIAASYHKNHGGPHAEVNAVNEAKDFYAKHKNDLAKIYKNEKDFFSDCTIYVTLEPCSHHGKTPPCTDLIIETGIKTLVYATNDPNPLVTSQGLKEVKKAGTTIINLETKHKNNYKSESNTSKQHKTFLQITEEVQYANRAFIKWIMQKKPWVTLKIASTTDGRMITSPEEPRWITNSESRKLVHKMRSIHQLLITGIHTIREDDPQLDVRYLAQELGLDKTKDPDILIVKSESDFTKEERGNLKIFQETRESKRQILECKIKDKNKPESPSNEEVDLNNTTKSKKQTLGNFECPNLNTLLSVLSIHGYNKIMIEAGPTLSNAFLRLNLVDEIIHFEPLGSRNKEEAIKEILNRYQKYLTNSYKTKSSIITAQNETEEEDICLKISLNQTSD